DVGERIGMADQLVESRAENACFRKRCTFFTATVRARRDARERDHELLWLAADRARRVLRDESQIWALDRLFEHTEPAAPRYAIWSDERTKLPPLTEAPGFGIRLAAPSDVHAIAALIQTRHGGPIEPRIEFITREIERSAGGETVIQVARLDDDVVGYAKASHFAPEAVGDHPPAPAGWYLLGVIVRPESRRRGIGHALTLSRLDWIARRSDRAYYFANLLNRVSIELHRRLGFVERTREVHIPGVSFTGGAGALYEVRLPIRPGGAGSPA
ncbi:MAG TPA: GNAT family N-acetyltransferase, partial [Dongiaceae bacterium]|nr:GNAT family N-acetyltransferase [Dongiaceae bacterium]